MNDDDWLRKRLRNPLAGCTPLLLIGFAGLVGLGLAGVFALLA